MFSKIKIILEFVSDIFLTLITLYRSLFFKRLSFRKTSLKLNTASICGNGPSLKEALINGLNYNTDVWVVNDFAISKYYVITKPKYYIFADPDYWSKDSSVEIIKHREAIFARIMMDTRWDMKIFVPNRALQYHIFTDLEQKNYHIKVIGYNTFIFKFHNQRIANFNLKYNLTAPGQNIIAAAIYIAINLGYKRIDVFGADHSWSKDIRVNDLNQVCLIDQHFYDSNSHNYHLTPWKKAATDKLFTMHEILFTLSKVFLQYEYLQRYALAYQVRIINRTPNSFIDSFPKE